MTKQDKLQKLTELANALEREAEETKHELRDEPDKDIRAEMRVESTMLLNCSRRMRGILSAPERHGEVVRFKLAQP